MIEKRRLFRSSPRGSAATGLIFTDLSPEPMSCTIAAICLGGASLEVPNPDLIPARFELVYGGVQRHCIQQWRAGFRIEVVFGAMTRQSEMQPAA